MTCDHDGNVIAVIRDHKVAVLIFDYSPSTGLGALQKVRHADLRPPAILIGAHPVDHEEIMALRVEAILSKPPDVTQLREALAALTATSERSSDFKILFQFLERCEGANNDRATRSNVEGG